MSSHGRRSDRRTELGASRPRRPVGSVPVRIVAAFPNAYIAAPMRDRIPASPWRLIGREADLDELHAVLTGGARLVTLTGAGGTGKTRLALALAESVADEFASSAFVDLSGL